MTNKKNEPVLAIGMMSGTSMDGVDAVLMSTNGTDMAEKIDFLCLPYDPDFVEDLRAILGPQSTAEQHRALGQRLTEYHVTAVETLLKKASVTVEDIHCIGFHGHTVWHAPEDHLTLQIGDGQLLADQTGIPVISDFRSADVAAGGNGAPLVPAYHLLRAHNLPRPLAILNIGGIANVTYIGENDEMLAFDTGPGNCLLDDWAMIRTGEPFDRDGDLSGRGKTDQRLLTALMQHPFFASQPPKSLDRKAFDSSIINHLSDVDGAATLAAFTAEAVIQSEAFMPGKPASWLVCGGGRKNKTLMRVLESKLASTVKPVEAVGWSGDSLEAEAFAYLALRHLQGLPFTWPGTTGVTQPVCGGTHHTPQASADMRQKVAGMRP